VVKHAALLSGVRFKVVLGFTGVKYANFMSFRCHPQQQQEVVQELEYQISLLNTEKQSLAEQIKKLQR